MDIISLEQLYLLAIAECSKAEKLDTVMQELANGAGGRLWLVRAGSTVPQASLSFLFGVDSVAFQLVTRNERELQRVVKFAEGIDGFLKDLSRELRAGLLAAPKRAAA